MSDYLNSLVTRTLGLAPVVQPRPASLFEPAASGPVSEATFAVAENAVGMPDNAPVTARMEQQPLDIPARTKEPVVENFPVHAVPPPILLPTQVLPATTFLEGILDRESKREVRDQELSPRSTETNSTTSANEDRHQPTPFLIRPEVRIVSAANDGETVQPLPSTPALTPVTPNATRADSLSQSRKLNAQAGDVREAAETVVVTIGRVDVRAIFPPPQAPPRAARTQPQPLSLDEYLKQRSEGRR